VGDVDGDGLIDLATSDAGADPLGCRDCGEVYVFLRANELPDSVWLEDTTPRLIVGAGRYTSYGLNLHIADLTADGLCELVIRGEGNIYSSTSIDQSVVVYGSSSRPDTTFIGTDTTITRIRGPYHDVELGRGLASADFNGDGVMDLAMGAHRFQGNSGRTYVFFGSSTPTDTNSGSRPRLALRQNYPNPFNPGTTIEYVTETRSYARLTIHDVSGRRVATLVDEFQDAGRHVASWNGRTDRGENAASGVYFCRLTAGRTVASIKLVLVR
jgi:hypothetical protein